MKDVIIIALICMVPLSCFVGATILALKKREGWGWLIFVGLLVSSGLHFEWQ